MTKSGENYYSKTGVTRPMKQKKRAAHKKKYRGQGR